MGIPVSRNAMIMQMIFVSRNVPVICCPLPLCTGSANYIMLSAPPTLTVNPLLVDLVSFHFTFTVACNSVTSHNS